MCVTVCVCMYVCMYVCQTVGHCLSVRQSVSARACESKLIERGLYRSASAFVCLLCIERVVQFVRLPQKQQSIAHPLPFPLF
jgi:hypothetical protein